MRPSYALVGIFLLCGQGITAASPDTNVSAPLPPSATNQVTPAAAVEPSPTPEICPSPSASPAAASAEESAAARRIADANALFAAVFRNEQDEVSRLLAAGTGPDVTLPVPVDPALAALFQPTALNYFLSGESGLTPLMVAATLGHREIAEILLKAGANPNAHTRRHGTNALWLAGYKGNTEVTKLLLGVQPGSEADRMRIEIDLAAQTAQLFVDEVAEEPVPISSGRKGSATPKGEFVVTNKHEHWRSTIYGASMPFYLRLSCRAFGLHAGQLPGYPASHGCIRLNRKDAQNFFNRVPVGTLVVIK